MLANISGMLPEQCCQARLLKNIDLCIFSLRVGRIWGKEEKTHIGSAHAPQGQSDQFPGYEKVCPGCQSAAPEKRVRGLDQLNSF